MAADVRDHLRAGHLRGGERARSTGKARVARYPPIPGRTGADVLLFQRRGERVGMDFDNGRPDAGGGGGLREVVSDPRRYERSDRWREMDGRNVPLFLLLRDDGRAAAAPSV